ncbi:unnamed protein product [Calypogeia fissa]
MERTASGTSRGSVPSQRDDSMYVAHNLILQFSVSMALKAVLELGIPDIIANAEGKKPLSAAEILAQLPTKSTPGLNSCSKLKRLFRPLVREGFFSESVNCERETVYGLTKVSNWFIQENESNITSIADLQLSPTSFGCWDHLHEVILDDTAVPFVKAHGVEFFEYGNTENTEYGALIQDGMVSYFNSHKDNMMDDLRQCGVLEGVTTLVDVGGGWGATIAEIVAEYPHIQGINFDLPHVIATAPPDKRSQVLI